MLAEPLVKCFETYGASFLQRYFVAGLTIGGVKELSLIHI